MKYLFFLIILIPLTGCQWNDNHSIKKEVTAYYDRPLCLNWQVYQNQKEVMTILMQAGLIKKDSIRVPAGIMGYQLQESYILTAQGRQKTNDKKHLCYGRQFVTEIKAIDFDHDNQAVVSFILDQIVEEKWAQTPFFLKETAQDRQLRRAFVHRKSDGGWQVSATTNLKPMVSEE